MDPQTYKLGLLMEAADAQQKLAEAAVQRLDSLSRSLEPTVHHSMRQAVNDVVGTAAAEAVSHTAQAEFARLRAETQRTAQALNGIRHGLTWNLAVLACLVGVVMAGVLLAGLVALGMPGQLAQIAASVTAAVSSPPGLRGDPAVLAEFAKRDLQVEVSLCGPARQPCVRVDPKGQTFSAGTGSRRETYIVVPAK